MVIDNVCYSGIKITANMILSDFADKLGFVVEHTPLLLLQRE